MNSFNFNNLLNSLNGLNTIGYNQEIALFLFPTTFPLALPLSDPWPAAGWHSRLVSRSCLKTSSQMQIQISTFHPIQSFYPPPSDPWSWRPRVRKGAIFYFALLESQVPIHSVASGSPRSRPGGGGLEENRKTGLSRAVVSLWSVPSFFVTEAQAGSLGGVFMGPLEMLPPPCCRPYLDELMDSLSLTSYDNPLAPIFWQFIPIFLLGFPRLSRQIWGLVLATWL